MIAAAGLALVAAPLTLTPSTASAADPVTLTFLNINDFHGRIDANTVGFAGTVEQLRAEGGEANTVFLSAGDNIGASLFASASADDNPTIDVLNALDLKASAVGNHEFDKGFTDLTGHVSGRADFSYLGANVYEKGTTKPALDEYETFEVGGLTVGVIGAVTQETPTLVTPGGISTLDFGDPVAAVNRVATQLSDGNAANGEADVIVAEYHEGAGAGTPDGSTLEQEVAHGGAFADIVTKTHAAVDAIFTGHTHKQYAWMASVPGGGSRPIVQTGSYGENIGQIELTVDPATMAVSAATPANVKRLAPTDSDGDKKISAEEQKAFDDALAAKYPRVGEVKKIVDAALAEAKVKGSVPVGEVKEDITTAFTGGSFVNGEYSTTPADPKIPAARDDRSSESTLGNLVADSLVASLSDPARGGAEIGVVNPGGLRADLMYAGETGSDTNKDGVITYAEANAVLPFVNNLWTLTLTGAQFKELLEQQWQTNADGTIPSRPYLHLGLSENVSVTQDANKPLGSRITSVRVDGKPLDLDKGYRIGTFSFLAQGGDNFRVFKAGTDVKDSGLIDRDAWIDYLKAHKPVAPSFDRRQVFTENMPTRVKPGNRYTFTLNKLDLTSLGSPKNEYVTAALKAADGSGTATDLGKFAVTNGSAAVSLEINGAVPAGRVVELVAFPSMTTVTLPVLPVKAQPKMRLVIRPDRIYADETHTRVRIALRAPDMVVKGKVEVRTAGKVKTLRLVEGKVVAKLAPYAKAGEKRIRVRYLGNATTKGVVKTVWIRVRR